MKKMLRLTVIVRGRDEYHGKSMGDALFSLYKEKGISGATILQGVRGYGLRGVARADVLGLSVNLPLMIVTIAEKEKMIPLLTDVKRIVGGDGVITLEEVDVI
jgi:uncharacterized protein